MREEARIKMICKLLEKLWEAHHDYRFGQLLINYGIVTDDLRVWNNEDDAFEKYLNHILKEEYIVILK